MTYTTLLTVARGRGRRAPEHIGPFRRRLIPERRIGFVRVGRHVRISESALTDFIEAGRVRPGNDADTWPQMGRKWPDAQQRRAPTFRHRPQAAVRPLPDPLSRAGWPDCGPVRYLPDKRLAERALR